MPPPISRDRRSGALPVLLSFLGLLAGPVAGCHHESSPPDPNAAVPQLTMLLHDPDADIRRTAAQALGKIGNSRAVGALIEGVSDQDPSVRESAAWALGRLSDADEAVRNLAGAPLVGLLEDPSVAVIHAAAAALGQVGAAEPVVMRLVDQLRHRDPETRRGAARALGGLEAVAAGPALLKALDDDEAGVRQEALAALGELGDRRAVGAFVERLLHDPNPGVRAEAAYRTGKLGNEAAVAALRKSMSEDRDQAVRRWASWALLQLEGEEAKTD